MRKLIAVFIISIIFILFTGCASKIVIPDEPIPTQLQIYHVKGGICLDYESLGILQNNINDLKEYADKLRNILEGL